jgi:hypothetical protein
MGEGEMITRLKEEDFVKASEFLNCSVAAIKAVAAVESNGSGFNPDETPKILFEGHWFYRYTKGKWENDYPYLCYRRWTKQFYGKTYKEEYGRYLTAEKIDPIAAMLSTSWGMFQIMGFNHTICGYRLIEDFVRDMHRGEFEQGKAFCYYIKNNGLSDLLLALDWEGFAYRYNGPEWQKNNYATKLQKAYERYKEVL